MPPLPDGPCVRCPVFVDREDRLSEIVEEQGEQRRATVAEADGDDLPIAAYAPSTQLREVRRLPDSTTDASVSANPRGASPKDSVVVGDEELGTAREG